MKISRYFFFFVFCLITASLYSQASRSNNAKIKTVFIYNFTRYFDWQDWEKKTEFTIGVLGADTSIVRELNRLASVKKVHDLPIKIKVFKNISEITYTEVFYVDIEKSPDYVLNKKNRNTLFVTENNADLHQAMIAFFVDKDNRQRFAINEVNIKNAGLSMNPDLDLLASHKITGTNAKLDEQKAKEWKSVFDKFSEALKGNSSEIKLSKEEAAEVMATMDAHKKDIVEKEIKLAVQEKEINLQQNKLAEQKSKIDQQLLSILTQDEKLKLQEQKLQLTIQQSKIQEADLENAKQEMTLQQDKINSQKSVLAMQQNDIDQQNKKLINLLGQINSQKTILYLAGFLVLIIVTALIFFVRGNKIKQRQNALLSKQKIEIEHQRELVLEKQKEIIDSINYARRIQYALLASTKLLNENLPEHFIYFKPKDVVSGDFYWGSKLSNGNFAFITADSTGHGVPGAIMSMLNISCLNEAVNADRLIQPAEILDATRKKIINHLSNDGSEQGGKDGMDCSLLSFDFANKKLFISAAHNPVWLVRGSVVTEIKPDKMPVGKHDKQDIPFQQHELELQIGDLIYTLTDGFPDQFGGEKGKKFMSKNLRELIANNAHLPMPEQKRMLETTFGNWIGNLEQVDDVCVIGIKI